MQLTQQPMVSTFAEALRGERERAGLSQRGLARRSGLTPAYLSLLESARRKPERPTVERIAAALDLDEEQSSRLLVAAGYAAGATRPSAESGPLAAVERLVAESDFAPEQRTLILSLVTLYAQGLMQRARSGKPLVSDLAAPWQQRVLEAMQEQMSEDFDAFRASFLRPTFDL